MSRRSETWNAYESKLAGPLPSLSTSVSVESTAGLEDPAYLVINPDFPLLREWIRVGTITPGLFENIVRNQEGSVGNIDHETGATVRAVFTKQLQDDIFEDIEDTEGAVLSHVNPVQQPDPHSQYLLELTAANLYVPLAGNPHNPMTGALHLRAADPTDDEEAAKKGYVDALVTSDIATHTAIEDAHHARYTDVEAILAVRAADEWLELTGGVLTGTLTLVANQIIDDGHTLQFHNDSGGAATFSADPLDEGVFRLRLGGAATAMNVFSLQGTADAPIADFSTTNINFQRTLNLDLGLNVAGTATSALTRNSDGTSPSSLFCRNIWMERSPSPTGQQEGDLWIDSISNTIQYWDGAAWVVLIDGDA